jgi:hypothetical protein
MTMEKNGAISSETPSCGNKRCACRTKLAASDFKEFPETEAQADHLDQDITKKAADVVKSASVKK